MLKSIKAVLSKNMKLTPNPKHFFIHKKSIFMFTIFRWYKKTSHCKMFTKEKSLSRRFKRNNLIHRALKI